MAHIYTQESVTKVDDQVTVKGTVDGVSVTITFWAACVAIFYPPPNGAGLLLGVG